MPPSDTKNGQDDELSSDSSSVSSEDNSETTDYSDQEITSEPTYMPEFQQALENYFSQLEESEDKKALKFNGQKPYQTSNLASSNLLPINEEAASRLASLLQRKAPYEFTLQHCQLDENATTLVSEAIAKTSTLKKLNLTDCKISLLPKLIKQARFEELHLLGLTDTEFLSILEVIDSQSLQRISLTLLGTLAPQVTERLKSFIEQSPQLLVLSLTILIDTDTNIDLNLIDPLANASSKENFTLKVNYNDNHYTYIKGKKLQLNLAIIQSEVNVASNNQLEAPRGAARQIKIAGANPSFRIPPFLWLSFILLCSLLGTGIGLLLSMLQIISLSLLVSAGIGAAAGLSFSVLAAVSLSLYLINGYEKHRKDLEASSYSPAVAINNEQLVDNPEFFSNLNLNRQDIIKLNDPNRTLQFKQ